jgi:amidase
MINSSTSISVPWTNLKPAPKLRIGVAKDDGVFTPSPPVRRALKQAVDLLRGNDDIEVIPINLPDAKSYYQDFIRYFMLSGSDVSPPNP